MRHRTSALPWGSDVAIEALAREKIIRCPPSGDCRNTPEPSMDGRIQFNGREIEVFINDRLLAPNSDLTRRTALSEFRTFFSNVYGGGEFDLTYPQDPRSLFGVRATAFRPLATEALLENLHILATVPSRI